MRSGILALLLFGFPLITASAEEPSTFIGTWQATTKAAGHDHQLTIALVGKTWQIGSTYLQNNTPRGTAIGTDIKFEKDALFYVQKYVKFPVSSWKDSNDVVRLTVKGKQLELFNVTTDKVLRLYDRISPPESTADTKKTTTADESQEEKIVGSWIWEDTSTWEETWTFARAKDKWVVEAIYKRGGKEIGTARGANPTFKDGVLSFTREFLKKPQTNTGADAKCEFKLTKDGGALDVQGGVKPAVKVMKRVVEIATAEPKPLRNVNPEQITPKPMPIAVSPTPNPKPDVKPIPKPTDPTVSKSSEPKPPANPTQTLPKDLTAAPTADVFEMPYTIHRSAFCPATNRLVLATQHQPPRYFSVYDVAAKKELWKYQDKTTTGAVDITSVAISPDGKYVAWNEGEFDTRRLLLFDGATGKAITTLAPLKIAAGELAFHPKQPILAMTRGGGDQSLSLINVATGKVVWNLDKVVGPPVFDLAFDPTGTNLAIVGYELGKIGDKAQLRLYNAAKGTHLLDYTFPRAVSGIAFSPDGQQVATYCEPTVQILDLATKTIVRELGPLPSGGMLHSHQVEFLPDGKTLAVATWDRHIRLYDLATGKLRGVLPQANRGGIQLGSLFATADGESLIVPLQANEVRVFRTKDAEPINGSP